VILMNPPFKGAVNADDVNDNLPHNTTKSELLFLHLILRALEMGGRVAVIVPDGVLFGSSRAHVEARRKMIEENRLDGIVSMPSGVFKPYAGVSTAVLFFTRGAQTKDIWFYDMAHDGFSLDDKRVPVNENDIPDVIECWKKRTDKKFSDARNSRIEELRKMLAPMKAERLKLHEEINRLKFESALDGESFASSLADAEARLKDIDSRIASPQAELDLLTRQFWVTKEQVKANKYDLSASRYRQVEADATYHERPFVTLERLARLESVMFDELSELKKLLK
jgi:type I restriction enzyme M protein